MSYSFNAQSKGAKILLQSDREDYGTPNNPTYMLGNVVKCPPGTFGYMGIEKMYFQQPPLFPSAHLNTTMTISYSPFSTNTANSAQASLYLMQSATSIVSTDFTSTFYFDNIPYPVTLADIGYDGSGGVLLASYLDCLLSTLNNKVVIPVHYNQCHPVFDFKCSLFASWRALKTVSSSSTGFSKADMATMWLRASCPPLSLFFKCTYASTTYVTNHEIETITVTLTDNDKLNGLMGRIFNLSSGSITLTHTVANPITQNATFLTNVANPSTSTQLDFNVGGVNYIKVFCDMSQGFKAAHVTLPGCLDTTLLAVIYLFQVYLEAGSITLTFSRKQRAHHYSRSCCGFFDLVVYRR